MYIFIRYVRIYAINRIIHAGLCRLIDKLSGFGFTYGPLKVFKKYASSKKGFSQLFFLAGVTLINYLPLLLYDAGNAVSELAGKCERLAIS